jgi:indole-3-glycerol phosphate synthase
VLVSADLLQTIVAAARRSARERERTAGRAVGRAADARRPRAGAFQESLRHPGIRIIAECKRRSPSRGVLCAAYDPVAIARRYEAAGAAAVSVLTEPGFFDGSLEHLRAVRLAVSLPVLRKDFIVTEFQVVEARAAGADAVLLIVAALDASTLAALLATAQAHELAALVEVHDRRELERALEAGAAIVGVNSRNLKTLQVNGTLFEELAPHIPAGVVAVAESGVKSAAYVRRLHAARYDAFLIGERLMVEADPGAALRALRAGANDGEVA